MATRPNEMAAKPTQYASATGAFVAMTAESSLLSTLPMRARATFTPRAKASSLPWK